MPLGALFGIGRFSDHRWLRMPAGVVVEFFRAIPVLILMIIANAVYSEYTNISTDVRLLYAVVTGLVLYNASVLAEIVRAGINSLPKGQTDAAKAIGMRKGQIMLFVLLPQAVTAMLPAIVSQLVVIVKDTALGGAVLTFPELLASVRPMSANYGANTIACFTIVAVIYIVVNFALTSFAGWLAGGPTAAQEEEHGCRGRCRTRRWSGDHRCAEAHRRGRTRRLTDRRQSAREGRRCIRRRLSPCSGVT